MNINKCVFLDRDGVLNEDRVNYSYDLAHFNILPRVTESLVHLKQAGFLLVVVTNQSGIAQGIYTRNQMLQCHHYLQTECKQSIDHFYFAPLHPTVSESLMRKPNSLMFEKAIAKFNIDTSQSWMVGDKNRDIIPAKKLGISTILIADKVESDNISDHLAKDLHQAVQIILNWPK